MTHEQLVWPAQHMDGFPSLCQKDPRLPFLQMGEQGAFQQNLNHLIRNKYTNHCTTQVSSRYSTITFVKHHQLTYFWLNLQIMHFYKIIANIKDNVKMQSAQKENK